MAAVEPAQAVPYPLAKRVTDKVGATLLILLLSPLFAAVFGAMALDMLLSPRDRGRWFYRERRVSRGREFDLLKFRTLRESVLDTMDDRGGFARRYESAPGNLTWTGRHLLKPWYIDELPQLFNVVGGDMSLVGPRPWPVAAVEQQVAGGHDYRNRVLAGWTGASQVQKGGPETGVRFDLEYVEACRKWSSWRLVRYDLALLWATLGVMLRRQGLSD